MTLHFTVLGRPSPAGSKRAFRHSKTNAIVVTDDAKGSRAWKQQVAGAALEQLDLAHGFQAVHLNLLEGPLAVHFSFFFARPKSHYGSGRNSSVVKASAPEFMAVRPDTTKLIRAAEDALTGILWRDDAQVVVQTAGKHYGTPERCEITVNTLDHRNGNQP